MTPEANLKRRLPLPLLFITLLLLILVPSTSTAFTLGDVNNDGAINVLDATMVMRHVLEIETLNQTQQAAADVNGDNLINVQDVTLIVQKALGIIDTFPGPEPAPGPDTIAAGTYLINTDIPPGRYRSDGGIDYWARLRGLSGELADIIANGALHTGSVYVDVASTDLAFSFTGQGSFYRVDNTYQGKLKTTFSDGMYWVGKDILPGRYRSLTGAGYWARLSGFSGKLEDIIENEAMAIGTVYVDISPDDVGFETMGAQWARVE